MSGINSFDRTNISRGGRAPSDGQIPFDRRAWRKCRVAQPGSEIESAFFWIAGRVGIETIVTKLEIIEPPAGAGKTFDELSPLAGRKHRSGVRRFAQVDGMRQFFDE